MAILLVVIAAVAVSAGIFLIRETGRRAATVSSNKTHTEKQVKTQAEKRDIANPNSSGATDFNAFKMRKQRLSVKEREVSIVFAGDIMLSRDVAARMRLQKDIDYPFRKITDYVKTADAAFANLESPITTGRIIQKRDFVLRADPGVETGLRKAGFTMLSLANNHMLDFGEKGLSDTLRHLKQAGIAGVGAGLNDKEANNPVYFERGGIKIAFLAYSDAGIGSLANHHAKSSSANIAAMDVDTDTTDTDMGRMAATIKRVKKNVDFVIVSMHAGEEYINDTNRFQVKFAHAAVDAGADLVIGHHPHVVQKLERYKRKYIFYSLGNFVFDQMWSKETREGLAVKVFFSKKKKAIAEIDKIELMPIYIKDFAQPELLPFVNPQVEKIVKRLGARLDKQPVLTWNDKRNTVEQKVRYALLGTNADSIVEKSPGQTERGNKISKMLAADINEDKKQEIYILENGGLRIMQGSRLIWKSKDTWWVDDFALADSNGDGKTDINMSVWRPGSFGSSKPFWIKKNDMSIKNHFFVFDFSGSKVKPVWQSSNLGSPNRELMFCDLDGDRKQELITIEGTYDSSTSYEKRYFTVWKWNGWGFSNEWRSRPGYYENITTYP